VRKTLFFREIFMRITQKQIHFGILAMAGALLISACASTPDILHETSPSANFASYKTFGYFSPLATDKAGYQSAVTGHLKSATRRAMEAKGYVYSENSPDLLINFYANVQDKQEVYSTPGPTMAGGYYGYRAGYYGGFNTATVDTYNYKQGTLTLDVIDAKQKALAWNSTAEGRVSSDSLKNPGPAIDTLVTNMMTTLPPASH
jgi:hypothetical protein